MGLFSFARTIYLSDDQRLRATLSTLQYPTEHSSALQAILILGPGVIPTRSLL
jgi:hypothetical protein